MGVSVSDDRYDTNSLEVRKLRAILFSVDGMGDHYLCEDFYRLERGCGGGGCYSDFYGTLVLF